MQLTVEKNIFHRKGIRGKCIVIEKLMRGERKLKHEIRKEKFESKESP